MVYLEKGRNKEGYRYWCAVEKKRIDGKVKRVMNLYLGSAEKIARIMKESGGIPAKFKSFKYGRNAALFDVSKDLGFVGIVDKYAKLKRLHGLTVGEYILLLIMGRCDRPVSKRGMQDWFNNSCMSLLWKPKHKLNSQNFLNHMNRLDKVIAKVEESLAKSFLDKGIKPSVLMLDRTNYYTFIEKGEKLPKKGKSKHHRNDKNLVDLGLVVSEENIPFLHTVHEANLHDAKSFPKMIDELVERLIKLHINTKELVLVFDKGNNSEPNIEKVIKNMHVVGSVRSDQVDGIMDIPLEKYSELYTNKKKHIIQGYREKRILFGREYTVLVTHNQGTEKRQRASYEKSKADITEKLDDLKRRLEKPKRKGRKRTVSSIEREIHDIIRKSMRPVFQYTLTKKGKGFAFSYSISKSAEEKKEKSFGKIIIFTDMDEWSSKKIAQTYNSKYKVEDDFKWFNNTALVSMKPFFVRLDRSIRSHVFVCVLGMMFYRYLFWKLKGFNLPGQKILEELDEIRLSVIGNKKGAKLVFEQMTPIQTRLFTELNLGRFVD